MLRLSVTFSILMGLCSLLGMSHVAAAQTEAGSRPQKHCGKCKCCKIHAKVLPLFDKNNSGNLEKDEMAAAKVYVKQELKKRKLAKYDKNRDGELSEEEKESMKAERRKKLLKKFDKNGNGKLDKPEKKKMKKSKGRKCSCPKRKKDRKGKKKKKKSGSSNSQQQAHRKERGPATFFHAISPRSAIEGAEIRSGRRSWLRLDSL